MAGGHIGFFAEDTGTGRTMAWRADDRFVMCSTFKTSLAAMILRRVDHGRDDLEQRIRYGAEDIRDMYAPVAIANLSKGSLTVREMCQAAVEQSDNSCANLLLDRIGGPLALTRFWREIGDTTSRLDDSEPALNRVPLGSVRNTTTPKAMARALRTLTLGTVLSPASRTIFAGWLIGSTTGFKRLRSGLPTEWITGDKTGNNGLDAAGDIAVTWPVRGAPLVIAAYTRGGSPTAQLFEATFKAIGSAVASHFARS